MDQIPWFSNKNGLMVQRSTNYTVLRHPHAAGQQAPPFCGSRRRPCPSARPPSGRGPPPLPLTPGTRGRVGRGSHGVHDGAGGPHPGQHVSGGGLRGGGALPAGPPPRGEGRRAAVRGRWVGHKPGRGDTALLGHSFSLKK